MVRPWRSICELRIDVDSDGNSDFLGTGWFAGSHTVVTAGHNLFDEGEWTGTIVVRPARDGASAPFGAYTVVQEMHCHPAWHNHGNKAFDIGVLRLDEPVGQQTGLLRYAPDPDLQEGDAVFVGGYPVFARGEWVAGRAWMHEGPIVASTAEMLTYEVHTSPGESGAPIWIRHPMDGQPHVVGVHVHSVDNDDRYPNTAVRMRPDILDWLQGWLEPPGIA